MHVLWSILHDKCDYVGKAAFGASLGYALVKVRSRSGQISSNFKVDIFARVDRYVLGSRIGVQHCPSSPNVPQNRYTVAPGWSGCRRGADRSGQVGCGKRASWGEGATAPPTVQPSANCVVGILFFDKTENT